MHVNIDGLIFILSVIAEATLAGMIVKRGMGRIYPILLTYLIFNLIEDPLGWMLQNSHSYTRFYFIVTVLDYVLQLLIVAEVAGQVIRPAKRSLPFPMLPVVTVAVLVCAIIAASFSPQLHMGTGHLEQVSMRVTLGLAILKLLLFAVLAGFAQMLGIGWKNHVLQFATGLAFYAAVSLFVQINSTHLPAVDRGAYVAHLVLLAQIQSAAYLATLAFWTWAFSRNEAPRKEFTPQMQQVLVTITGTAKRTRLAVTRSAEHK